MSTKTGATEPQIARISLYFSLLAGNLGRRPVRVGLRPQPVGGLGTLFQLFAPKVR